MNTQKPREIAARLLHERENGGEFTEELLDQALKANPLAANDRRLLQEILFGVVRWQAALDWLIDRKTAGRTQKAWLRILLRLGLYQIFWLDRIPAHAAVHETVQIAKRLGFGPQSGFINAVLRGYLREKAATTAELDALKSSDPPVGLSHPAWIWRRWSARWGADAAASLMAWNNGPAGTFARVNLLKTTPPALQAQWQSEHVTAIAVSRDWIEPETVFELTSAPSIARLASFRQGGFYVQDPSTLLAVERLDPQPDESILDLCAAPGGKTAFIAQRMGNCGRIVAQDARFDRLQLLQENCRRLGVTCVHPSRSDAIVFPELNARFDRILIDAPCSNTGVMRRRVDLRWRLRAEEIQRLARVQQGLLRQAAALLKPGGLLVYSTCSLEAEENEQLIAQFLREQPDFRLNSERLLLPWVDGVDGAYVARLTFNPAAAPYKPRPASAQT